MERTPYATIIYCDNQGAIALAKDPKFHPRTKHIAIQHHWVREKIAEQEVDLQYVETNRQIADGLTKALPKDSFEAFRAALGLEGSAVASSGPARNAAGDISLRARTQEIQSAVSASAEPSSHPRTGFP